MVGSLGVGQLVAPAQALTIVNVPEAGVHSRDLPGYWGHYPHRTQLHKLGLPVLDKRPARRLHFVTFCLT